MTTPQPANDEVPILDHVTQALLNKLAAHPAPPVYTLPPEEARNGLLEIQAAFRADSTVQSWSIPARSHPVRLRTVRPHSAPDRPPVIMYFHGGGWVLGDWTSHERLVTELSVAANAAVVFVDYDRAPEHRYPVAIEQAYAATCYVAEHADELALDGSRLAIAGDSAGGNLAAVTALRCARSHPRIAGQLLFYPATNADFETDSYRQFAHGPWLTKDAMQWFWKQYLPDATLRQQSSASPLLASLEELAELPRTLIITAECDVLRDEGEAYGRRLTQAGVDATATRYNGTIHDFMMLNALAHAAPTRAALAQAIDFLKSTLS
jgi:acetyl esterase